jgi:hypothetical protein
LLKDPQDWMKSLKNLAGVPADFAAGFAAYLTGVSIGTPSVPCESSRCDVITVDVALPEATRAAGHGGMIVQIDWYALDLGLDLDLAVYDPSGSLAARSTDIYSYGESVWIAGPRNGRYTIVVEPSATAGQPVVAGVVEPLRYDGFVGFEHGRTIARTELDHDAPVTRSFVAFADHDGALLPDVVPTVPADFHLDAGWGAQYYIYGDRSLRGRPSCYPVETLGLTPDQPQPALGPMKCLRWTQGEYNLGDGPLEMHIYPDVGNGSEVYQRVYRTDGTVEQFGPVGSASFSWTHGHFHYRGWQDITLSRLNEDGSVGDMVRRGVDKGICMTDIRNARFGRTAPPASPLAYPVLGTCDQPTHRDRLRPDHGRRGARHLMHVRRPAPRRRPARAACAPAGRAPARA